MDDTTREDAGRVAPVPWVMAALVAAVQEDEQRVAEFVEAIAVEDLRLAVEALAVGAGAMVRQCVGEEVGEAAVVEYARANAAWLMTAGELREVAERGR